MMTAEKGMFNENTEINYSFYRISYFPIRNLTSLLVRKDQGSPGLQLFISSLQIM